MGSVLLFHVDSRTAWIFGLFLYLSGVSVTLGGCPSSWATAAERCIDTGTGDADTSDTPDSTLSYQSWVTSCQKYNSSIHCMDRHIRSCLESGGDALGAISIRGKMLADLKNVCSNNDTFEKYKEHSECLILVANNSLHCHDAYIMETAYEYMDTDREGAYIYTYEDSEDTMEHELKLQICSAMKTLLDCVNRAVRSICGEEAVDLYDQMVLSQIPSHITETCSEISSSSSGVASMSAWIWMLIILCMCGT